jgi:hypothetical protein
MLQFSLLFVRFSQQNSIFFGVCVKSRLAEATHNVEYFRPEHSVQFDFCKFSSDGNEKRALVVPIRVKFFRNRAIQIIFAAILSRHSCRCLSLSESETLLRLPMW